MIRPLLLLPLACTFALIASAETIKPAPPKAEVSSIAPEALKDFESHPKEVRDLIRSALMLTELNLTYMYGSANPDNGGMDCSGTIYHLLRKQKVMSVPRQSDHICGWLMKKSAFTRTEEVYDFDHDVFESLQAGDLLFWSGTYDAGTREIPVTHVMLYLGERESDGKPLVFGASNGRSYEGQRRCGVSVFDFRVPSKKSKSSLYGFGTIPGFQTRPAAPAPVIAKAEFKEEIRKAEPAVDGEESSESE